MILSLSVLVGLHNINADGCITTGSVVNRDTSTCNIGKPTKTATTINNHQQQQRTQQKHNATTKIMWRAASWCDDAR
jgi:hypothetical protein